jgi:hypothetical protein
MTKDLRVQAMDYALQARANAEEDIVELAMRILCFLRGYDDIAVSGPMHKIEEACGLVIPPPLPDLVQQVSADAGPDLSKSDQTPTSVYERLAKGIPLSASEWSAKDGLTNRFATDDDVKTRLVRAAEVKEFTEAK